MDKSQTQSAADAIDATMVSASPAAAEHTIIANPTSTIVDGISKLTSLPRVDLTGDSLLLKAPRMMVDGLPAPAIGGIPLLAKLGQGGMGAVYYGIHPVSKMEVAVKVLPQHLAEKQPELIQRFHREAEVASKINSPHLVSITDINQQNGVFYLVMEFVLGTTGGSHLKQVKLSGGAGLPEADALDICIAASSGLAEAHRVGVVHRDVKPDNILIPKDKAGGALNFSGSKLADLGLARAEDNSASLTGTNSCMGTAGFMAPEQIMDAKRTGKPGDVFSMGATLYALLAARPPFQAPTLMASLMATTNEPHAPIASLRPDISKVTSELLDRCLAKDPAKRYVDGSALLEALRVCRNTLGKEGATLGAIEQLTMLQHKPESGVKVFSASAPSSAAAAPGGGIASWKYFAGGAAAVVMLAILGALAKKPDETKVPDSSTAVTTPAPVPAVTRVDPPKPGATETPAADSGLLDAKLQAKKMFQEHARAGFQAADERKWNAAKVELELALAILGAEDHPLKLAAQEKLAVAKIQVRKKDAPVSRDLSPAPNPYSAAMFKGHTAMAGRQYEQAAQAFAEAQKLNPGDAASKSAFADASYELAMESARRSRDLQRFSDAETSYMEALRFKPADPAATKALDDLRRDRGIAKAREAETDPRMTPADRRDAWRSAQRPCVINSPEYRLCDERVEYWSRVVQRERDDADRPRRTNREPVRDAKDAADKIRNILRK